MNYLLTVVLLFMTGSCSKDAPSENEDLAAVKYRSQINQRVHIETQEVFALDLKQYHTLVQIRTLENRKNELEAAIEGGDERLIPVLESVMLEINTHVDRLTEILDLTCTVLKMKAERLVSEAREGNDDAQAELERLEAEFEKCGIDVWDYYWASHSDFLFLKIGREGTDGGCQDPGRDWNCKALFNEGVLRINILEGQQRPDLIRLVTPEGEVLSVGEEIGQSEEFEGVGQIALELEAIDDALIEIRTEDHTYQRPVQIR